ncbi:hypothetical protein MYX07_05565 [Patescibacteria group bacterium AH-259-L07]|nr:hypothetical protein [Patescibacteria group bacterium AH-259-L07]
MKRNHVLTLTAVLLTIGLIALIATNQVRSAHASLIHPLKIFYSVEDYDYFLSALDQFPHTSDKDGEYHLGTRTTTAIETDGKGYSYYHFVFVTRDRQMVSMTIKASAFEIDFFRLENDLFQNVGDPLRGKFFPWHPVFHFPKNPASEDGYYRLSEVKVVGRFHIKYDRNGTDPNKILGYGNEVY